MRVWWAARKQRARLKKAQRRFERDLAAAQLDRLRHERDVWQQRYLELKAESDTWVRW